MTTDEAPAWLVEGAGTPDTADGARGGVGGAHAGRSDVVRETPPGPMDRE